MRRLPTNRTKRHKIIIEAVRDFYGIGGLEGVNREPNKKITSLQLFLMNRKKRLVIKNEWKDDIEMIKNNLDDLTYRDSIESSIC